MKNLTYKNINCIFNFENVSSQLTNFWLNEVKRSKKTKIWLTITVTNNDNKSFVLITNLPFNTSDYTDVLIVLKQSFNSKLLSERKDLLDNITFKYSFEQYYKHNSQRFLKKILISLLIILWLVYTICIVYLIYIDITQVIYSDNIPEQILEKVSENLVSFESTINSHYNDRQKKNNCIFDIFIKLFDQKDTNYFPSHFVHTSLPINDNSFNLLEYIIYNQYIVLAYTTNDMNEYITSLDNIIRQYQKMVGNILM